MAQEQDIAEINQKRTVNVSALERVASLAAGTLFIYNSVKQGSLGILSALAGGYLIFRGGTGHCAVYSLIGKRELPDPVKNINIRARLHVKRPRHEVYAFWRRLENMPRFMKHLESVRSLDGKYSVWKATGPAGIGTIEWKAEIVKDEPGEFLGWSSVPDADIHNAGKVEFHDGPGNTTELNIVISYRPPLREIGEGIAKLFNPLFEKMVREDVNNFKVYIETGKLPEDPGPGRPTP